MCELLTTKEIAKYLRLRPETILRMVNKGEIPAIRIGGRFRFDKAQIDEWLRSRSTSNEHFSALRKEEALRQLLSEALEDITATA